MLFILKNLNIDEDKALINADLILNIYAFQNLVNVISINAIRQIKKEWLLFYKLIDKAGTTDINLRLCEYKLLLRFSLPCKHYLL